MVTETQPEEQVATPDAESQVAGQQDAALTENAGTSSQAESQEATLPDNAEDYVNQVLEQEGQAPKASDQQAQARPRVDPEEVARRIEGVKTRHGERQNEFNDSVFERFNLNSEEGRKSFLDFAKGKLNEHHNDLLQNAGYAAAESRWQEAANEVWTGALGVVPKEGREGFDASLTEFAKERPGQIPTISDVFKAVDKTARTSGYSDGYKKGLAKGFDDGRSQRDSVANAANSGQTVNGSAPSSQRDDELLLNPNTPIETVREILARQNGQ